MNAGVEFKIPEHEGRARLEVTAPKRLLHHVLQRNPEKRHLPKPVAARIFQYREPKEGDTATWVVQAAALGQRGPKNKQRLLQRTHRIIHDIVTEADREGLPPNLWFNLKEYGESWRAGEFSLEATIARPVADPQAVRELAAERMLTMASNLHCALPAIEVVYGNTSFDLRLGSASRLASRSRYALYSPDMITVEAERLRPTEEPLIYLAGALAIAHADTLVKQPAI